MAYKLRRRPPKLIDISENRFFEIRISPSLHIILIYTIARRYREPILYILLSL
jgi:hypothetical protein